MQLFGFANFLGIFFEIGLMGGVEFSYRQGNALATFSLWFRFDSSLPQSAKIFYGIFIN